MKGSPGTGRTLAIELLAEHLSCPMLIINVDDIDNNDRGDTSHILFDLALRWQAFIIVQDTAPIIDMTTDQSASKAVALTRVLEWSQGNSKDEIDPQFSNYIDLIVTTQFGLTDVQSTSIWKMFLNQLRPEAVLDITAIYTAIEDVFTIYPLNGSQIRKVVRTQRVK